MTATNPLRITLLLVCGCLLPGWAARASEITFTFENPAFTSVSGETFFGFDVYAAGAGSLGPALVLINYNADAFGARIAMNGAATVTPGFLFDGNESFELIVNDNTSSRLAITVYHDVLNPGTGITLSPVPQQLLHVEIRVADAAEAAGLSFESAVMQGQQYAGDLESLFTDVTADDIEDYGDTDGDGVEDGADECPVTKIPESVPTVSLKPNHFALIDGDVNFDAASHGRGKGSARTYTTADTRGCSCEQIIALLGLEKGHVRHGCPVGIMDRWAEQGAGKGGHSTELPNDVVLEGNYPNPFNPQTTIRFALPTAEHVQLAIFDLLGREVRRLVSGKMEAGRHELSFEAGDLPSGLYVYRLSTNGQVIQRTMMLLR